MSENQPTQNSVLNKHNVDRVMNIVGKITFYILVGGIFIYTVFPFYWAFNTSIKTEQQAILPTKYIHDDPTFSNYEAVFNNEQFTNALLNSTIVSSISVVLSLVIGSFAAYALGRVRFRGRVFMMYAVLAMTMFPQISILSGLYGIVRELDLTGSVMSLVISYPIFTLPFTVWVLTAFFKGLPSELEQAALVDGASPFQVFYRILLPLTLPALVTTGLLTFIAAWNEYLFALTFTATNADSYTVPVSIALFSGEVAFQDPVAEIMAATVVVTIPLIVLVLIFQRQIVGGLTAGAVKG